MIALREKYDELDRQKDEECKKVSELAASMEKMVTSFIVSTKVQAERLKANDDELGALRADKQQLKEQISSILPVV